MSQVIKKLIRKSVAIFLVLPFLYLVVPNFVSASYSPFPVMCGGDKYYEVVATASPWVNKLYKQIGGTGTAYLIDS